MLSPSQGIPAKWPRHCANRNLLSIKLLRTQTTDFASCIAFRLNKDVFPWWVIAAPYFSRLRPSEWSYTVTPTLCTCQEPPEQSQDEWGWVKDPDVDVRRAAAWNKRGSTTKPEVKRPCCCWKGLCCCWRGATTACSLPCKHSYWHPEAVTVTLHWQTCSQHSRVSPQQLVLALIAMKMCSRGFCQATKWKKSKTGSCSHSPPCFKVSLWLL